MKIRTLAVCLLFVSATVALADHGSTPAVLMKDGSVYTVAPLPASQLELVRRAGEERLPVLVPGTDDEAIETEAQLAYDAATSTLFVVFHSGDSLFISRLLPDGTWTGPMMIYTGAAERAGLVVAVTHVQTTTLLNAVWWDLGDQPVAKYALVAFEDNEFVSSYDANLAELAGANGASGVIDEQPEAMTEVLHPPLAMAKTAKGGGVEIVFGDDQSTRLTRLILEPKIRGDVRIWKPGRRAGKPMPRAGLMSVTGEPVKALLSEGGRIVLYTPETQFRFVIYENGEWSPERMIQLDERLTREKLVEELRKAAERLEIDHLPDDETVDQ